MSIEGLSPPSFVYSMISVPSTWCVQCNVLYTKIVCTAHSQVELVFTLVYHSLDGGEAGANGDGSMWLGLFTSLMPFLGLPQSDSSIIRGDNSRYANPT